MSLKEMSYSGGSGRATLSSAQTGPFCVLNKNPFQHSLLRLNWCLQKKRVGNIRVEEFFTSMLDMAIDAYLFCGKPLIRMCLIVK